MATKPAQICQLQKGKLIDTQKGFVDTFNWVAQSVANLKGGENCDVTWPTDDTPTIDCTVGDNESSGGGGITEAVYDVIADTQDDKDGITISYTDDREDKFIPFLSSGGGLSAAVTDVGIQNRAQPNQYDKLSVLYSDGHSKSVNLPMDNAVKDITRSRGYYGDVLSVTYTRSTSTKSIDLGITLSSNNYNSSGSGTTWLLKSASDSNVKFYVNSGQLQIGVYYI